MKAFIVDRYGSKTGLRFGEVPIPEPREDEVLVQVHAAGVNLLDSKIASGEFKLILPYRLPFVMGHDVAGVVVKVGAQVRQFKVGDEVYSRPEDFRIGAFAEYIAIRESSLALKPKTLTMEEAASVPLVGLTAWQALVEKAKLKKGQRVFIQAGSGGVGTFAIQLAKHLGATVATTTSTANVGLVKSLHADVVIDYKKAGLREHLARLRRGPEQSRRQDTQQIPPPAQGRRKTHLHLRATGPGIRQRNWGALVRQVVRANAQRRYQTKSETPRNQLFVPVHEGSWRPVARDHASD